MAVAPGRFVSSVAPGTREPVADDPATVEDVRAIVRLKGRELIIATELGGGVRVLACERDRLPQRLRTQLAFHEVASGAALELAVDELWLLDLQALEMLPDAPGANDALYVYGALRGPYPEMLGKPVTTIDGQLTVTRADLLHGIADSIANAFAYAPEPRGARCVHALLPGERADVIERGRGVILALPLAPAWTLETIVPNDLVAAQIVYDVTAALCTDLGEPGELPVPSRAALEDKLVATGWRIAGSEAVRARSGWKALFGGAERTTLPRQANLDELIALATAYLAKLPGTPSGETMALRRRSHHTVAPPKPPAPPPPSASPSPSPPAASAPRPHVTMPRSEWMKDFIAEHRVPSRPPPQVSVPARAVARDAQPAWMDDFAEPAEPANEPAAPTEKPDWSKDFD